MANSFCYSNPLLNDSVPVQPYQEEQVLPALEVRIPTRVPTITLGSGSFGQQLPLQLSNQGLVQRQQELNVKQYREEVIQKAVQTHHEEEMKFRNCPWSKKNNILYNQGCYDDGNQLLECPANDLARTPIEIHNLYEKYDCREYTEKKTVFTMMMLTMLGVIIIAATDSVFPSWSVYSPSSIPPSDTVINDNIVIGMDEEVIVGIKDGNDIEVGLVEEVASLASEIEDGNNEIDNDIDNLYFVWLSKQDYYVYDETISYVDNRHLYNLDIARECKAKATTMTTKSKISEKEKEVKDDIIIDTENEIVDIIDTKNEEDDNNTGTMMDDIIRIVKLIILAMCLRHVDKMWKSTNENDDDDDGSDYCYDWNNLYDDCGYINCNCDDENDTTTSILFSIKTIMGRLNINLW